MLAKNAETLGFSGTYPDLIELHNAGNSPASLDGWGLTDDAALPFKYAIPPGTTLPAGAYLVIHASSSASVPAPKTGFGLKDQGDTLTLTRSVADGGGVADSVAFGNQLSDYSIGRRPADGAWDLCRPSFGAANIIATQGDPRVLRINEWLAANGALSTTDFIELFNPGTLPVNIGGGYLTDNPVGWPDRHPDPAAHFRRRERICAFQGGRRCQSGTGPPFVQSLLLAGRDRFVRQRFGVDRLGGLRPAIDRCLARPLAKWRRRDRPLHPAVPGRPESRHDGRHRTPAPSI